MCVYTSAVLEEYVVCAFNYVRVYLYCIYDHVLIASFLTGA